MKCQCCGKRIYCECDARGFKVGQYVRTTKEYSKVVSKKAIRGRIIELKGLGTLGGTLAVVKTFFGGKESVNTQWLREPFDGKMDAFYEGQIDALEEEVDRLIDEKVELEREAKVAEAQISSLNSGILLDEFERKRKHHHCRCICAHCC